MFNPLTGIIECFRSLAFPTQFAGWQFVGVSAAIGLVTLVVADLVFKRLEAAVLKEI